MEERKVTLSNGKEFVVKELKYKDVVARAENTSKEETAKFLLQSATGISNEDYENLSMKNGIALQRAVNEVNGLDESFLQKAPLENNL